MYINTHSSHRIRRSARRIRGRSRCGTGRSRRRRLHTHKTKDVRERAFCAFVDGRRRTVVIVSAVSAVAAVAARGHAADGAAAVAPVRAAVVVAVCQETRGRGRELGIKEKGVPGRATYSSRRSGRNHRGACRSRHRSDRLRFTQEESRGQDVRRQDTTYKRAT